MLIQSLFKSRFKISNSLLKLGIFLPQLLHFVRHPSLPPHDCPCITMHITFPDNTLEDPAFQPQDDNSTILTIACRNSKGKSCRRRAVLNQPTLVCTNICPACPSHQVQVASSDNSHSISMPVGHSPRIILSRSISSSLSSPKSLQRTALLANASNKLDSLLNQP